MPARARLALIGAGTGAGLLVLTWVMAFHVGVAEHADQSVFVGFADLRGPRVDALAQLIADLCDPQPFVWLAALVVLAAFARGRFRMALTTGAILLGANLTTHLLKPLLAQPRAHWLLGPVAPISSVSWPSGHATAAMSLALACVVAAPARWRPAVAALGAAFAVAVSFSFLTLGWHYPSDVLGGFLVATTWTLLAVAALFTIDARRSREPSTQAGQQPSLRGALGPLVAAPATAAVLAGLVALARPHQLHPALVVGATAIAALGLVLATAVMLSVRR